MRTHRRALPLLGLFSLTAALAAGCLPGTGPGGSGTTSPPTSPPTSAPTTATAAPTTTAPTSTPPGGTAIPGTWTLVTTADGMCTDSPRLIGASFVAEGTTLCSPSGSLGPTPTAPTAWTTKSVPEGERATAAVRFPPGGGLVVATDDGPCIEGLGMPGTWDCHPASSGFPYTDITGLANIAIDAIYVLPDSIAYVTDLLSTPGTTWPIPTIVGAADAIPTRITTIELPTAEIWSGTNGHGVVAIDVAGGTTTRHTTADGLPSGDIRDLASGSSDPKLGSGYPVWAATAGGVARWDGTSWATWTTADGLPSDDVRALAVTNDGVAWVATAGGPASFDGTVWHGYGSADGVPGVEVMDVAITPWGVWFATPADGLLVFLPS